MTLEYYPGDLVTVTLSPGHSYPGRILCTHGRAHYYVQCTGRPDATGRRYTSGGHVLGTVDPRASIGPERLTLRKAAPRKLVNIYATIASCTYLTHSPGFCH